MLAVSFVALKLWINAYFFYIIFPNSTTSRAIAINMYVCLFVCMAAVYLSVCLSVGLSVCLSSTLSKNTDVNTNNIFNFGSHYLTHAISNCKNMCWVNTIEASTIVVDDINNCKPIVCMLLLLWNIFGIIQYLNVTHLINYTIQLWNLLKGNCIRSTYFRWK